MVCRWKNSCNYKYLCCSYCTEKKCPDRCYCDNKECGYLLNKRVDFNDPSTYQNPPIIYTKPIPVVEIKPREVKNQDVNISRMYEEISKKKMLEKQSKPMKKRGRPKKIQ